MTRDTKVTEKQKEAIIYGYNIGFYNYPKDAYLSDIGDALGLSPVTVAERVRRGAKNIIGEWIEAQQKE